VVPYRFCPDCGNSIPPDAKTCPNCGTLIEIQPLVPYPIKKKSSGKDSTFEPKKKDKSPAKKWGHLGWIFLLLGGAIGLYALFTPTGSINLGGLYSWDMWMFGYSQTYDWETGWDNFWTGNEDLLEISIGSTIFVVMGNIIAIIGAFSLIKRGVHKSNAAIAAPIAVAGAALFYLAGYEVMFQIYSGGSFWGVLPPAFGIYGQFLAAFFMVLAFFITRSVAKYQIIKNIYIHQENIYSKLNTLIEKAPLQEDEKEAFNKQLEVLELQLKSIDLSRDKKTALIQLNQISRQIDLFFRNLLFKARDVIPPKIPTEPEWKQRIPLSKITPTQQTVSSPPTSETSAPDQEEISLSENQNNYNQKDKKTEE
jgi:hypothetical protein